MEAVVASVIAVLGTLLGAVVAGLLQHRMARRERTAVQASELRRERLAAVTALVAALAEHRRAMWVREDLRLSGAAEAAYEQARAESHATRAAITAPLTAVRILVPALAEQAELAARASYGLRRSATAEVLDASRMAAIDAADRLVGSAATAL
ncbi:protein kilB [Streptomyces sp. NPDC101490]|uniref:protein kilB n=1 Tax=Streptomyces sp. NPDC101490 TaxID=3366143 RepID=UPI0038287048